jgi:hypothetical protein
MTDEQKILVEALTKEFHWALTCAFMNNEYCGVDEAIEQAKLSIHRLVRQMTNKEGI